MLPLLRARRESQNLSTTPAILCLQPRGQFNARTCTVELEAGAALLVMTDGFYRLVDPYALCNDEALFAGCEARGLGSMLDELRGFEHKTETAERAVKSADDASALLWTSD